MYKNHIRRTSTERISTLRTQSTERIIFSVFSVPFVVKNYLGRALCHSVTQLVILLCVLCAFVVKRSLGRAYFSCRQRRHTLKPGVQPLRRNPRLKRSDYRLPEREQPFRRALFVAFSDGNDPYSPRRVSLARPRCTLRYIICHLRRQEIFDRSKPPRYLKIYSGTRFVSQCDTHTHKSLGRAFLGFLCNFASLRLCVEKNLWDAPVSHCDTTDDLLRTFVMENSLGRADKSILIALCLC